MSKHLIVNADDYGRTASISAGIRYAHLNGIVTTTTAMMNFPAAAEAVRLAQAECPRLGLGVQLNLTTGRPSLPMERIPTLVDRQGAFLSLHRLKVVFPSINPAELRAEWQAQIENFLKTGATLDHLGSYDHASYLNETAFRTMLDLAQEYQAPIRSPYAIYLPSQIPTTSSLFVSRVLSEKPMPCPRFYVNSFYEASANLAHLLHILNLIPNGVGELMCHPGYVDEETLRDSSYTYQRESELKILTSPEAKEAAQTLAINLSTFREVL